eukprot:TRINITY_DN5012_c0_g1_i1.p1 TRINITY_DN5012_c0_g1~~TRINITY_DN5012_c0_g1_i1.p1  ORF type:complete len:286 (+),score=52.23 TRINITY_DN5012_c0_g1_i1:90-947(+)
MSGMAVMLSTGDAPPVCAEVPPDATVETLRAAAVEAGMRCAETAVLTFAGQELPKGATLADLGIGSEAMVHVSLQTRLRWETKSAHAVIEEDTLRHTNECKPECNRREEGETCDNKATAWLSRGPDDPGVSAGTLRWQIKLGETATNSAFGIAHVPEVPPIGSDSGAGGSAGKRAGTTFILRCRQVRTSLHFNSTANGRHTWMWYAGGSAYHGNQSSPINVPGDTPTLCAGELLEFELDMDKKELRALLNGIPTERPIFKDLPDLPLHPFVELQTPAEWCELVPS